MEITEINKCNLIKLKSFRTIKETINKTKTNPLGWEKMIANKATDKAFISKIYKRLIELNIRKTNSPIKKWGEDLNRHFPKEDTQAINTFFKMLSIAH